MEVASVTSKGQVTIPKELRQRLAARRLVESGQPLMVSKSVVLELEWVMRGRGGESTGPTIWLANSARAMHHGNHRSVRGQVTPLRNSCAVELGQEFTVTKRGEPIARIIPYRDAQSDKAAQKARRQLIAHCLQARNAAPVEGFDVRSAIEEGRD